jgi:hypothetical protein
MLKTCKNKIRSQGGTLGVILVLSSMFKLINVNLVGCIVISLALHFSCTQLDSFSLTSI